MRFKSFRFTKGNYILDYREGIKYNGVMKNTLNTPKSVWEVLIDLKRSAAYNGITYDFKTPGCAILNRAQKYLERGTLLSPGFSTGGAK